jgi:hypothetical protein
MQLYERFAEAGNCRRILLFVARVNPRTIINRPDAASRSRTRFWKGSMDASTVRRMIRIFESFDRYGVIPLYREIKSRTRFSDGYVKGSSHFSGDIFLSLFTESFVYRRFI